MKKTLLIADDVALNRDMLAAILGEEYFIAEARDGDEAIEKLNVYGQDVVAVLLDLVMPKADGYKVLEYMKSENLMDVIPVLIITAESSKEVELNCLNYGISDFIRKPFDTEAVKRRVKNTADLFSYKNELEDRVADQTETLIRQNRLLEEQTEKMRKNNEKIIDLLGTIVEYRNFESGEHIKHVKGYTRILANTMARLYPEYGLTKSRIDVIAAASPLHDIGKIAIPESILLKPGKLTPDEFEFMKIHTTKGCDIIEAIEGAWDEEYGEVSYDICRHHHERFDGKGYPDGLKGDEIPVAAQLVSIADVYDALVSKRVYKEAYGKETAYQMILNGECGIFSPKLLECFKEAKPEFEALAEKQN